MMGQGYSDPIGRMSRTGSADPPDNNPYVPLPSASQETSTTVLADALPEIGENIIFLLGFVWIWLQELTPHLSILTH
jgi:hypothetical protein